MEDSKNYFMISEQEGRECYGKPCYCLICRHTPGFCTDEFTSPCECCSGLEEDINKEGFCVPEKD